MWFSVSMICKRCFGKGQEPDHSVIGQEMRDFRVNRNVSARRLAKLMGLSPGYICRLEHGRNKWSEKLITKYKESCLKYERAVTASLSAAS